MFKSKKFTIAFSILAVINVALMIFLITLLPKKSNGEDFNGYQISTGAQENTVPQPTQGEASVRPMKSGEEHVYPLIQEIIEEKGTLTLNPAVENTGGVVFHKKPAFDGMDAEGNVVNFRGAYDITGKIFILDNDKPYLMYVTNDGYYVTSNKSYVNYSALSQSVAQDPDKVTTYGYDSESGIILTVYAEDGNHVVFSVLSYDGATATPILDDVVAQYDAFGVAHFEFMNGHPVDGTLAFQKGEAGVASVTVKFDEAIEVEGRSITELTLNK